MAQAKHIGHHGAMATRGDAPAVVSLDALLGAATSIEPLIASDGKSGALIERALIDGEPFVVKHLHADDDWIMRVTGDVLPRPLVLWRTGVLAALPSCIDHAIVGVAGGLGRNGWGCVLLMRDVGALLVPEGDAPVSLEQSLRFLDHMAALHAAFWDWRDDVGLLPRRQRFLEFNPSCAQHELDRGGTAVVPGLIVEGWKRFPSVAPRVAAGVLELLDDPSPLADGLAEAPSTLIHGDWKMGNLGSHPDGRTILLDWAVTGEACALSELGWYLALNCERLPHSKEDAIAAYRAALERHGVSTAGWWDRAVALALLGAVVQFGWEKALGGPGPELGWWEDRAAEGLARL